MKKHMIRSIQLGTACFGLAIIGLLSIPNGFASAHDNDPDQDLLEKLAPPTVTMPKPPGVHLNTTR
jgi:hypothetical protein